MRPGERGRGERGGSLLSTFGEGKETPGQDRYKNDVRHCSEQETKLAESRLHLDN